MRRSDRVLDMHCSDRVHNSLTVSSGSDARRARCLPPFLHQHMQMRSIGTTLAPGCSRGPTCRSPFAINVFLQSLFPSIGSRSVNKNFLSRPTEMRKGFRVTSVRVVGNRRASRFIPFRHHASFMPEPSALHKPESLIFRISLSESDGPDRLQAPHLEAGWLWMALIRVTCAERFRRCAWMRSTRTEIERRSATKRWLDSAGRSAPERIDRKRYAL